MRVLLQWATSTPGDWDEHVFTSNQQIEALVKRVAKGEPRVVGRQLDNAPGWLNAWGCQGVTGEGWDHVAFTIRQSDDALVVSCWNDDPVDWPSGSRWAMVWTFLDPAPDHTLPGDLKGAMNTRQTSALYAEPGFDGPKDSARPWSEFVVPPIEQTFHGAWLSDHLYKQHNTVRKPHEWGDWVQ